MNERILLEQEHKAAGSKFFLASMANSHVKHLIKLAQDESLIDLLGWNTFFNPDETEEFIEAISSYAFPYSRKSQPLPFGIYLNKDNFPIGYVVLKGLNMDLLTTEIGIAIMDKKYRNKGYGTLALKRLILYAFQELHIQTIGAVILLSNNRSINMFKNLDFVVREIMYKSWPMPNGELADMVLMELKNDNITAWK
ncbi:MAG: GNAT family N-acetyltransferase [Okeania sp. SIO3B5]|uniref:GNAT family N-acetyltransferase n=1 Tax=Okeania sp. SIO3B5 TaxID=2607811 RepID=UPI0013FFFCAC|nr:GNAT family N-acetyltransferase [Okeania sp. SIO3B5]NEO51902.1 GNAT family N-acetyltransferase [Okeania sp. SIO3B5]